MEKGRAVAEALIGSGWTPSAEGEFAVPGTAATPVDRLPAVRLYPPGSREWFIELLEFENATALDDMDAPEQFYIEASGEFVTSKLRPFGENDHFRFSPGSPLSSHRTRARRGPCWLTPVYRTFGPRTISLIECSVSLAVMDVGRIWQYGTSPPGARRTSVMSSGDNGPLYGTTARHSSSSANAGFLIQAPRLATRLLTARLAASQHSRSASMPSFCWFARAMSSAMSPREPSSTLAERVSAQSHLDHLPANSSGPRIRLRSSPRRDGWREPPLRQQPRPLALASLVCLRTKVGRARWNDPDCCSSIPSSGVGPRGRS